MGFAVGQLTIPASTGVVSVTGLGFRPKLVILFGVGATSQGSKAHGQWNWGCWGPSKYGRNYRCCGYDEDAQATSDNYQFATGNETTGNHEVYANLNGSGTIIDAADAHSMTNDGFEIDVRLAGNSEIVNYIAIGGDITAEMLQDSFSTGTHTNDWGFKPDAFLFLGDSYLTTPGAHAVCCFGALAIGKTPFSGSCWAEDAVSTSNAGRIHYSSTYAYVSKWSSTNILRRAALSSQTNETTSWSVTQVGSWANRIVGQVALAGGQHYSGTFTYNGSTTTQSFTGFGFRPDGVILLCMGAGTTGSGTSYDHAMFCLGAADGTNQFCAGPSSKDADSSQTVAKSYQSNTSCVAILNNDGTRDAEASLQSLDPDGITLDWSSNPGTSGPMISVYAFQYPRPAGHVLVHRRRRVM